MGIRVLVAALLLVLVVGCEPCKHYNRLQVVRYMGALPAKPYGTVRPYQTAQEVGRPFETMGFMSCEAPASDEAAVLKAMLYRAADMGADGVLLNPTPLSGGTPATGTDLDSRVGWAAVIGNGDNRAYRAQAIRFKDAK
jgi:hypothetical protein